MTTSPQWLLLTASLSGKGASSARVRLWRTLKDLGAASLRDGVTLVPASEALRIRMADIQREVESAGGSAWLIEVPPQAPRVDKEWRALFDRADAFAAFFAAVTAFRTALPSLDEAAARRQLRQLDVQLEALAAVDFFPSAAQARAREALEKIRVRVDRRFSPAEPTSTEGEVPPRRRGDFRGRRWATRQRLWVDRAASAWLISRFIDPDAQFLWLERPADCPADAVGFDFDGAAFTHVGERVTFEVLLAAFALNDAVLDRLGRLVRFLDVGGEQVAEAPGFEAVLAGLRGRCADDDALLAAIAPVLDALHEHFSHVASDLR